MKTIKAEQWQLYICNGVIDMVHGNYYPINEFYIPKYKIAFNMVNDNLNAFETGEDRYNQDPKESVPAPTKISDVNIPESLAESIKMYIDLKKRITEHAIKFFMEETHPDNFYGEKWENQN